MKPAFESLKSEKFGALDANQMAKIKGAYHVNTSAGPFEYKGRVINGAQDIQRFDNNDKLLSMSFYAYASDNPDGGVADGWYTIYY